MPISTFLNGRHYTQLRGAPYLFLSEVGHTVAPTYTSDTGGGVTETWLQGTVDIPCRLDVAGGGERLGADVLREEQEYSVTIPANYDINVTDRFAIEGRGTFVISSTEATKRHAIYESTGQTLRTFIVALAP